MIFTDSRYADGIVTRAIDSRNNTYQLSLFRQFPEDSSEFYLYTWTQRDRIDLVANEFLGDPSLWWVLMDYNPEIVNPLDIPMGTSIRIPGV
jgi:prophage DNA circulation protein